MRGERIFKPHNSLWIRTFWSPVEPGGRVYICWQPNHSMLKDSRESVLKFFKYPKGTDTRKALDAFIDEIEEEDSKRSGASVDEAPKKNDFFSPSPPEEEG